MELTLPIQDHYRLAIGPKRSRKVAYCLLITAVGTTFLTGLVDFK